MGHLRLKKKKKKKILEEKIERSESVCFCAEWEDGNEFKRGRKRAFFFFFSKMRIKLVSKMTIRSILPWFRKQKKTSNLLYILLHNTYTLPKNIQKNIQKIKKFLLSYPFKKWVRFTFAGVFHSVRPQVTVRPYMISKSTGSISNCSTIFIRQSIPPPPPLPPPPAEEP